MANFDRHFWTLAMFHQHQFQCILKIRWWQHISKTWEFGLGELSVPPLRQWSWLAIFTGSTMYVDKAWYEGDTVMDTGMSKQGDLYLVRTGMRQELHRQHSLEIQSKAWKFARDIPGSLIYRNPMDHIEWLIPNANYHAFIYACKLILKLIYEWNYGLAVSKLISSLHSIFTNLNNKHLNKTANSKSRTQILKSEDY